MTRDRFIDRVRVASVVVVVLGHWTATSVRWSDAGIIGDNALAVVPESHHFTWLFQVMPLLFFVGGFANARSLGRHDTYLDYLQTRLRRLLAPTLVFIVAWLVAGLLAVVLPLPSPNLVDRGADIAALPFWFVGLYVIVIALAPAMLELHRRWGWRVPLVLAVSAVVVDVLTYPIGLSQIGAANYALVWLLPHQLGFFYADGVEIRRRWIWTALTSSLAALVVLTSVADYPVSMIFVPGAERGNTEPPSLAIVAVSVLLIAAALLAKPWLERRDKCWADSLNKVPLSLYLWHVSAIPLAVALLYPAGFPQDAIGSRAWWLWRPVWLLTLAAALFAITLLVRRFEIHPLPRTHDLSPDGRRNAMAVVGSVIIAISLLGFGVTGFNRPFANTGEGLLGFTMNPLLNSLHLVVGLAVVISAYRTARTAVAAASGAGVLLVSIGLAGRTAGVEILGANADMAVVDLILGLTVVGSAFALLYRSAETR